VSRGAGLSDAQLVARCRTGDEAAWREFVDRFSRYVYAIAVQGFRLREHDAEDVFQDVFARAYERLGDLRSDDAVRPWLAQLTRRRCVDQLRSSARELPAPEEELEPREVDETLSQLDEAVAIHEAMAQLPEQCGDILDRFFAQDQSYRTIGAELELPSGTIASRISRCLKRMRDLLEGRNSPADASRVR
jgi:RNA polymerase sigma factor (sigma-70 family)